MKKIILCIVILGALSLLIGCGGSSSSSHKKDDPSKETLVLVTCPTEYYGDAIKLAYSSAGHLITVKTTLSDKYKDKVLLYNWYWDSTGGAPLFGTDDVYNNAEFIYRPNDTSIIPPDVTYGTERVYNRGFKLLSNNIDRYLYLIVKTSTGATLDTIKFYVAEPVAPPAPNQ